MFLKSLPEENVEPPGPSRKLPLETSPIASLGPTQSTLAEVLKVASPNTTPVESPTRSPVGSPTHGLNRKYPIDNGYAATLCKIAKHCAILCPKAIHPVTAIPVATPHNPSQPTGNRCLSETIQTAATANNNSSGHNLSESK